MARLLGLPLFDPGVHYGSVYDYYELQAQRERPGGTRRPAPQPAFDFFFLRNRPLTSVWLPGDESALLLNGIDLVAFHRGMYEQGEVPGAWFGWHAAREAASRPRRPAAR